MHAKARLSSSGSGHSSPSPPSSPTRRSSPRYGRRTKARPQPQLLPRTFLQRFMWKLLSVFLRRHGFLLFAPLVYISGMLLYMGTTSFEPGSGSHIGMGIISDRPPPGSVYRSHEIFQRFWPLMQSTNDSYPGLTPAWQHPRNGEQWVPCIQPRTKEKESIGINGYLLIEANGGLNQQRVSICNAVAVAGLLNATLVIPNLRFHSIWRDPSKFKDIYDVDHFISTVKNDVKVVTNIPDDLMLKFDNNVSNIFNFRIKAWSPVSYYEDKVLPKLLEDKVIRISPFANRLSYEVPYHIQRLRCLANYEALKFSESISTLARKLVERMIKHSSSTNGKYISVHLRFEEDMVAFSCCIYDGGVEEKKEMDAARERGWRGKFNRTGRIIRPGVNRMSGKCPLTPLEVGMMLRGMGYDTNTSIFLAAGKIYKAEKYMLPLQQMFPLLQTKETLATPDELAPFHGFSSRMAALDYTVCLHSEVFVTTQGGNFPHFLIGHRRYLYGGHSRTIQPDKRKLAVLLDNVYIGWSTFKKQMQSMRNHSDVKGIEMRKFNASVYTFPVPDCMCRKNPETLQILNL